MVGVSDNRVGLQPSRGYIAAQRILSGNQGANAALKVFGRGKYLLGGWCGPQSTVDLWQVEPFRALQSVTLEMQLADMAAGAEAPLVVPPGVSADRSDWAPPVDEKTRAFVDSPSDQGNTTSEKKAANNTRGKPIRSMDKRALVGVNPDTRITVNSEEDAKSAIAQRPPIRVAKGSNS